MTKTFDDTKAELLRRASAGIEALVPKREYSLREKIALTCRVLHENGHGSGLAGQITARATAGTYYTQQFGFTLEETSSSSLVLINEDLELLEGEGMPNPANRFHSWIYRARPDVSCVIHTHPLYTAALSQLEVPLAISHMDNCMLYEDVAFVSQWPGVPFGNDEGELISGALGDKRAVMLSHHGLLVAGSSVEEACALAVTFERAARMQLLSMAAGEIKPIDPEKGREAHKWFIQPKHSEVLFAALVRQVLSKHAGCLA